MAQCKIWALLKKINVLFILINIVDLQCCVNPCYTVKWFSYTHSFLYPFPLCFITGYWIWFPVLYSRTLVVHPFCRLYLLIPNSHCPFPTLLGNYRSVFCVRITTLSWLMQLYDTTWSYQVHESSNFVLSQGHFGYSGSLAFCKMLLGSTCQWFVKISSENLIGTVLNVQINL